VSILQGKRAHPKFSKGSISVALDLEKLPPSSISVALLRCEPSILKKGLTYDEVGGIELESKS